MASIAQKELEGKRNIFAQKLYVKVIYNFWGSLLVLPAFSAE